MTPYANERCARCGQQLREGDRFCMACGTRRGDPVRRDARKDERVGGLGESEGKGEAQRASEWEGEWEYAHVAPRLADQQRGASKWVYEAIGSHPTRGSFSVRSSPEFSVADAAFGPTLDWRGRLEGQEALSSLVEDLRADGWQRLAKQKALAALPHVLTARLNAEGGPSPAQQENPAWSQFIFRRPARP